MYSKLVVNTILSICNMADSDSFKSQLDIALGHKPDLIAQLEQATTSAECNEIEKCTPKNNYNFIEEIRQKNFFLLSAEFVKELSEIPETSDAYREMLSKYPNRITGYEEAAKKQRELLSQELSLELQKVSRGDFKACYEIARRATWGSPLESEAIAMGDLFVDEKLKEITTEEECGELRYGFCFPHFSSAEKHISLKESSLKNERLEKKLREATTTDQYRKILEAADREGPIWEAALEKIHEAKSQEILEELEFAETSEEAKKLAEKSPGGSKAQKKASEKYYSLLSKELLAELALAKTLDDCLAVLDKAPKNKEIWGEIWKQSLLLFTDPRQLPKLLKRAGFQTPEAYEVIKKAADMLKEEQESPAN